MTSDRRPSDRREGGQTRSGSGPSDAALVLSARAGERWAQEALFHRYARLVNGLAYRLLGGDADAEDLVQDAFALAFSTLSRLEDPGAFRGWLASIVVRQAGKRLRRRRLLVRLGLLRGASVDVDAFVSPAAPPDVVAEVRAVYRAVERLPAEAQVALILRRIEGRELADIATEMGLSLATVKRRLAAAESELRSAIDDRGDS